MPVKKDKIIDTILIILMVLTGIAIWIWIFGAILKTPAEFTWSFSAQKEEMPTILTIRGNALIAISNPVYSEVKYKTLAAIIDKIVQCESGGDPKVCNKQYGCSAGQGLFQLIPSTVEYCEQKLGRKIDPFDKKDNTDCAMWLIENEGLSHWKQSKECWET